MKKIGILILFAFFVFQIQAQQKTTKKTTGVVLKFNKTTFQYGNIYYGSNGTHAFKFVNTGSEPLLLSRPRSSCGCTVPSWPKAPILPGDSGTINVAYNTHILGEFNKTVTVHSNAPKPVVLRIHGKVIPRPKPMLPVKQTDKGGTPIRK